MAGKRDLEKIRGLKEEGRSKVQIARNKKMQIRRERIRFETVIGEDFLKELDAESFTESFEEEEPEPERKPEVIKDGRWKVRHLALTSLYLLLGLALVIGVLWIVRGKQSEDSMAELRQAAGGAAVQKERETAPTEEAGHVSPDESGNTDASEPQTTESGTQEAAGVREILPRFRELHERNPELCGWLYIEGTGIDYPVMYRENDNDFYLSHDFDGKADVNGLLVLDKRCDPDAEAVNALIHGHHMRSGAMFGSLKEYEDPIYCREHPRISFSTLYEERTYEIFAVFKAKVYDEKNDAFAFYDYIRIENEMEFESYVKNAELDALYDTGIRPQWGDRLLTLSTCEYSQENGRLVVVARERNR